MHRVFTGSQSMEVFADQTYRIHANEMFTAEFDGHYIPVDLTSKTARFVAKTDGEILITIDKTAQFGVDIEQIRIRDTLDSTPFEIPDHLQGELTIEQKIERAIAAHTREKYGADQFETLAESMDFDMDNDGDVELSGHEVYEMDDEIIPLPPEEALTALETPTEDDQQSPDNESKEIEDSP